MKKILMVIAVVAAFGISAMAQEKGEGRLGIAFDAGASKIDESDRAFAYTIGVKGDYGISDNFFVNATLGYAGRKGGEAKVGYITLPVNVGWSFVKKENFGAFVEVGPYFDFKVSGDKMSTATQYTTITVKPKGFEMGLGIGVGCEFVNHIQARVFYNLGLTDSYKVSASGVSASADSKIQYFGIGVAYMF